MSEKFKEHKAFATGAKEVGFDKDERKLAAMDPGILLEGLSDEIKNHLNPETLISFLGSLEGEGTTDGRDILSIGNLLYQYRTDVPTTEGKNLLSLNENDRRLLTLACKLLENALYSGKLRNMKKEEAAALAFSVNVMAKLLEQYPPSVFGGFDIERLNKYIDEVFAYEQSVLFPKMERNNDCSVQVEAVSEINRDIEQKLQNLEDFDSQTDWNAYFTQLADRLESSVNTIEQEDEYFHDFNSLRYLIDDLRKPIPEPLVMYREEIQKLKDALSKDPQSFNYYYDPDHFVSRNGLCGTSRRSKVRLGGTASYFSSDEHAYKRLSAKFSNKKVESSEPAKRPTQKFKGFDQLGAATRDNRMANAVDAIALVFDGKKIDGPLLDFQKLIRIISNLGHERKKVIKFDNPFSESVRRVRGQVVRPAGGMYLIKARLIADNILTGWPPQQREYGEEKLATLSDIYKFETNNQMPPSHNFLEEPGDKYSPKYHQKEAAYANLHFIPNEIPFAVWALKYSKSQEIQKTDSRAK